MNADPKGFIDKLIELCIGLLIGAIALYGAVMLVRAIWTEVLVLLGGGLIVVVLIALWRSRSRGW